MPRRKPSIRLPDAGTALTFVLMMAAGFALGWLAAAGGGSSVLMLMLGLAAGTAVQVVLHEGGHLAAGLATGYGFVSFRIGSVMLVRQGGRLRLRRYRLAGTGGQCLLSPPPWREEGFPVFAYNIGGPAANLLAAGLFALWARAVWQSSPALGVGLLAAAVMGGYLGLVNGIPMRVQGMPNDGYNALCLRGNAAARRALWAQLAINAAQTEGARLRDIPESWFVLPGDAGPGDPLTGAVWVCRYSRLLDAARYDEAAALRDRLLDGGARLAAIHRLSLEADRAFFLLLDGRTEAGLRLLREPQLRTFLRQMKQNPGVALVQYAAALAGSGKDAAKARAALDKALAGWPYRGDVDGTRELTALAEARLCAPVTESGRQM